VLDGRGQREEIGGARKDADGPVGVVLDEPLAGRREDGSVQESLADQDVRPGAGLGDGGLGRARDAESLRVSWSGTVARHGAGPPVTDRGFELGLCRFSRTRDSARRGC
jgi:hypothetical protein